MAIYGITKKYFNKTKDMGSIGKLSRNHHQLSVVYVQCNCVQLYTHHQLIMSHNYQQTGWLLACPVPWLGGKQDCITKQISQTHV